MKEMKNALRSNITAETTKQGLPELIAQAVELNHEKSNARRVIYHTTVIDYGGERYHINACVNVVRVEGHTPLRETPYWKLETANNGR